MTDSVAKFATVRNVGLHHKIRLENLAWFEISLSARAVHACAITTAIIATLSCIASFSACSWMDAEAFSFAFFLIKRGFKELTRGV